MNLNGCRFKYGGNMDTGSYDSAISSEIYGLIFANVESDPFYNISGEIKTTSVFNAHNKKNYYIGNDYSDAPIHFDAEIVTCDGSPLSHINIRAIEKWLFYSSGYKRLYVLDEDTESGDIEIINDALKRLFLYCRFVNPEKIEGNGGVIGFAFSVDADSAALYQDAIEETYTSFPATIHADTDLNEYVYPKITLNIGSSGGSINLVNVTDDASRITGFDNLTASQNLIIDSEHNFISGDNYYNFVDKNFPRLIDGNNTINVSGDISSMTVKWFNRRYM